MLTGLSCDCPVCAVERSLIAQLRGEDVAGQYRSLTAASAILSGFHDPLELIQSLHSPTISADDRSGDRILSELLDLSVRPGAPSLWQRILVLVFIPTIHRTTSQVAATFPSLAREDISQHIVMTLLEFLPSKELKKRDSHIAFTIARRLRRITFRWAIRESRCAQYPQSGQSLDADDAASNQPLDAQMLLKQFLDNSQRAGWLSQAERDLLIASKLEGVSCPELARRNGHSSVAIQHRIQRLIDRLRRLARRSAAPAAIQLDLFDR